MSPQLLSITPRALERIKSLLDQRGKPSVGVRIGVRSRGCSGLSYTLEYADDVKPLEEVVSFEAFQVIIDPKAVLFIVGTEMDYEEKEISSGFVFVNPNEKGRCGCGESFHV